MPLSSLKRNKNSRKSNLKHIDEEKELNDKFETLVINKEEIEKKEKETKELLEKLEKEDESVYNEDLVFKNFMKSIELIDGNIKDINRSFTEFLKYFRLFVNIDFNKDNIEDE